MEFEFGEIIQENATIMVPQHFRTGTIRELPDGTRYVLVGGIGYALEKDTLIPTIHISIAGPEYHELRSKHEQKRRNST